MIEQYTRNIRQIANFASTLRSPTVSVCGAWNKGHVVRCTIREGNDFSGILISDSTLLVRFCVQGLGASKKRTNGVA